MKNITLLILLTCSFCTFAQDKKEVNLIQADKTWGKEIIQVPFWFAPEINYKGQEDIRFAKGWEDITSDGFWALVFAWDINLTSKPTTQFFEENLKLYFDGLMKVVNEDTTITIPKTKASFSEKEGMTRFIGTVETYDAFTTKKMLKLNVTIESYYCKQTKHYIPLFRFAPRDFKHKAWEMLKQTKLHKGVCNNFHKEKPINAIDEKTKLDKSIWVVLQDAKDNYWFGSNSKGIYHYNGKQLKLFTTEDGLVDNTIRGVQEDKIGNIFIETPKGISKYNGASFETLKPIISQNNSWKLEPNDLWFGYNANDLYRYDGDSLFELKLPRKDLKKAFGIDTLTSPFNSNNPYSVFRVDKDNYGNIWFGTFVAGVFRYDGKSFLWFGEKELSILADGIAPGVRSIIQDKEGYFWLSNFKSKYKIETNTLEYKKIKGIDKDKPYYFNSGLADKDGNLWMTTYRGGVWKYDGDKLLNFPLKNGTTEVLLISIFQDNKGVLWLGTDNDGVYKQKGQSFEKFEISH